MVNKLSLSILVSIILTIIIISLVNVGISVFIKRPQYDDYCNIRTQEIPTTQDRCEELGGQWNPEGKTYPRVPVENATPEPVNGFCDLYYTCQQDYDSANENYNQIKFYIVAFIGFVLLLIGLFSKENLVQITGLASGGILVGEGVVINFQNELIVFLALIAIFVIFGVVAHRVIRSK